MGTCASGDDAGLRVIPPKLGLWQAGESAQFAVVVTNPAGKAKTVTVRPQAPETISVNPESREIRIPAQQSRPAFFWASVTRTLTAPAHIQARTDGVGQAVLDVGSEIDLSSVGWKIRRLGDAAGDAVPLASPGVDDSSWDSYHLGSVFMETGVSVIRASLKLPEHWNGRQIRIRFSAVDDNDITYLNGVEIGRTLGWDKARDYLVPPELLRPGMVNTLAVAIHNVSAGGGIYREPNSIGISPDAPAEPTSQRKVAVEPPGKVGPSLPLRPMHVDTGVLRYPDDREVALFGVNYYPQSWYQFENLSKLGVDKKLAIRRDLDAMVRLGVQIVRIHVFDREISDAEGNIIPNEHLDLLDYLVSEGSRRGIYFMFTPIAWWPGPNEQPGSFSGKTPKEAMPFAQAAVRAQENYLRQFLSRRNVYTGRRYCCEPAVCALEIMNEPAYWGYFDMPDEAPTTYADRQMVAKHKAELREQWANWCKKNGCEPEYSFYQLFRYQMMLDYLTRMHRAIRSTGARQPVACSTVSTYGQPDLLQAIADSPCEAITFGNYVGEWHVSGDGRNLLEGASNQTIDPLLAGKARLVYEFDALNTRTSYMYPAFARGFRANGAQIAAMFQYDSEFTARYNSDWDVHYLNLLYTPSKAASFLAASELFRTWPRGTSQSLDPDDQVFTNEATSTAVSYKHDVSLFASPDLWISSNPSGWNPLDVPKSPRRIVAVGDSPYARYGGNGWWEMTLNSNRATLAVFPDVQEVADPYKTVSIGRPVTELRSREHEFELRLPGVRLLSVTKGDAQVPLQDNAFTATPGTYLLEW